MAARLHERRCTVDYELSEEEFTTPQTYNIRSCPRLNQIKFNFLCIFKKSGWLLLPDSAEPLLVAEKIFRRTEDKFVCISVQQILSYKKSCIALKKILSSLSNADEAELQKLMDYAWGRASETVRSNPTGHKILNLHFNVCIAQHYIFTIDVGKSSSLARTADSSIQSLARVAVDSGNMDTICSICLEDYSDCNCEVLGMPCSHIFHGDCIKKWLRVNHYCPVCRHEMPTN